MSAINEVLDAIASRFKSGNSIPVERVHITTAELSRLQSSLAEKDETIAELRARCEAAELDASRYGFLADGTDERFDVTYWIDNEHQELFCDRERLSEVIDAALAAQHAQRKEEES